MPPFSRAVAAALGATTIAIAFAASAPLARQAQDPATPPTAVGAGRRGGGTAQPPVPTTGFILGRVVDAGTNQPVAGAVVTLNGGTAVPVSAGVATLTTSVVVPAAPGGAITTTTANVLAPPQRPAVMTNAQGQFLFRDLGPGTYTLALQMPGYVSAQHTQVLEADQRVTDVTISIAKLGAITGTVRDEQREPVVNASVRVLRRAYVRGQPGYVPAGAATTDDRGMFRAGNLQPGAYVVVVPMSTATVPTVTLQTYREALRSGDGYNAGFMAGNLASLGIPLSMNEGYRLGDVEVQVAGQITGRGAAAPVPSDENNLLVYRTLFHPSATSVIGATVLNVGSGETHAGADIQLQLVKTSRVTGDARGPDGPLANIPIRLLSSETDQLTSDVQFETATTVSDANGRFTFAGVPPGLYVARAQRLPQASQVLRGAAVTTTLVTGSGGMVFTSGVTPPAPLAAPTGPQEQSLWGQADVSVGERDVTGTSVQLYAGATVSGALRFEGPGTPPAPEVVQRAMASLAPVHLRDAAGQVRPVAINADGTFITGGYPPGRYRLTITGALAGWTMAGATARGRDVFDVPIELGQDSITGAVVTYIGTAQTAQITGMVSPRPGESSPTATVILFPSNYQEWIANGMPPNRLRQTAARGQTPFSLSGLLAGDYYVVALETAPGASEMQDPATFARLAAAAERITLATAERKTVALSPAQVR